jgi:hypothetical protein
MGMSSLPMLNHRVIQTLPMPSYPPGEPTLYVRYLAMNQSYQKSALGRLLPRVRTAHYPMVIVGMHQHCDDTDLVTNLDTKQKRLT